jgi:hypothetical protein
MPIVTVIAITTNKYIFCPIDGLFFETFIRFGKYDFRLAERKLTARWINRRYLDLETLEIKGEIDIDGSRDVPAIFSRASAVASQFTLDKIGVNLLARVGMRDSILSGSSRDHPPGKSIWLAWRSGGNHSSCRLLMCHPAQMARSMHHMASITRIRNRA